MDDLINELYYGNLCPVEQMGQLAPEEKEILKRIHENEEKLEASLNAQGKALLHEIKNDCLDAASAIGERRFRDLRHTFATTALEHGMDIKTLSAVSSAITIGIYSHITDTMRQNAVTFIDCGIAHNEAPINDASPQANPPEPAPIPRTNAPKFTPYTRKIRKSGTGSIYRINDHLFEGPYTPASARYIPSTPKHARK